MNPWWNGIPGGGAFKSERTLRTCLLTTKMPEAFIRPSCMANRAIPDDARAALQIERILVIAIGDGGIDGMRGAVTGSAVDTGSAVGLAVAIQFRFAGRQLGVGGVNVPGLGFAKVLPVT